MPEVRNINHSMENNTSSEVYEDEGCYLPNCLFSQVEIGSIIAAFTLLFLVSLVGNLMVLYLIVTKRSLKRANKFTIFSLSVADLTVTVFCIMVVPLDLFVLDQWILGAFMCKLITFIQHVGVASSMLHLAVVTLQNFVAVCFPFYARALKRKDMWFSCAVWCLAVVEAGVYTSYKSLQEFPDGSAFCLEEWPSKEGRLIFLLTNTALLLVLPVSAIAVLNVCSIVALCKARLTVQGTNSFDRSSDHAKRRVRRTEGAVKKIFIILAVLVICGVPYQAFGLWSELSTEAQFDAKYLLILYIIFIWLYFANMASHPLLYTLMSWGYREVIRESFGSIRSKRRSTTVLLV